MHMRGGGCMHDDPNMHFIPVPACCLKRVCRHENAARFRDPPALISCATRSCTLQSSSGKKNNANFLCMAGAK